MLPWAGAGEPRGEFLPEWATTSVSPWRGEIPYFPGIPARLLRGADRLESSDPDSESWMILLSGSGVLRLGGKDYAVQTPVWVRAPRGGWSLRGKRGELVALEFLVPAFDGRLFTLGVLERYLGW